MKLSESSLFPNLTTVLLMTSIIGCSTVANTNETQGEISAPEILGQQEPVEEKPETPQKGFSSDNTTLIEEPESLPEVTGGIEQGDITPIPIPSASPIVELAEQTTLELSLIHI